MRIIILTVYISYKNYGILTNTAFRKQETHNYKLESYMYTLDFSLNLTFYNIPYAYSINVVTKRIL